MIIKLKYWTTKKFIFDTGFHSFKYDFFGYKKIDFLIGIKNKIGLSIILIYKF